jgi:hypothetical protein
MARYPTMRRLIPRAGSLSGWSLRARSTSTGIEAVAERGAHWEHSDVWPKSRTKKIAAKPAIQAGPVAIRQASNVQAVPASWVARNQPQFLRAVR